ncbi:LytTR family DNA-binding domain-containing protein [Hansschlegelia zhihuaiae]|nr:LytTR family DNA-binding domain-containing protein [Hansschlegelia zhihuaiae]
MREFAKFPVESWLRQRVGELGLALGLGLAFAYVGPFRTDESEFLPKLGYWAGLLACWFIVAALVEHGLRTLRAYRNAGLWARRACLIGVASLPMLLVVAPATTALLGWRATLPELIEMYWQIVLVCTGVVILSDGILGSSSVAREAPREVDRRDVVALAEAPATAEQEAVRGGEAPESVAPLVSRLAERLPPALRAPIICLEMEDHYVRVHTDRGSVLVLMRLGDAIQDAAPTPGAQSHRSWWVATDAIESFERTGRVGRLQLRNGLTAPVSQRYVRTISELAAADRQSL